MTPAPPTWWRRRRRDAQWWAGGVWQWLGRALPEPAFLGVGAALAGHGAAAAPRLRRRTVAQIAARLDVSVREAEAIAARMFRHFGTMAAELAIFDRLVARIDAEVELCEADAVHLRALQREAGGLIIASGHLGNWELMAARLARALRRPAVFARAPADARWAQWLSDRRAGAGIVTQARGEAAGPWRSLRRLGAAVGLLVDRRTAEPSVRVPFFGAPVWASTAPARLHRATGWPVVVATTARRPAGGHRISIDRLEDVPAAELTARIQAQLEARIRARPEAWIWFHDRWSDPAGSRPPRG